MSPKLNIRLMYLVLTAALSAAACAQGGSMGAKDPFTAPNATVHYAPDRMYDLQHLSLEFNVDYPNRAMTGVCTNEIAALRDGVTQLRFNASEAMKIQSVQLNGQKANYKRDSEGILVDCPPTKQGEKSTVVVHYSIQGTSGGWHWNEPKKNDPSKVGFWTNGETSDTRDWTVTWDYPNDFTTSETKTTVPVEWEVISNGSLVSDTVNPGGKTRTVYWKMDQPHATYLTSIVAGPFDIKKDDWRGMPLYFEVPKGKGDLINYSFAHTKDMLSFYSDNLGVRYPWTKYAQDCEYDFGGGQENVSCTTLGEAFLTDPRAGYYEMDWLNSHEMGHQWFGDYVTCKDWGQIWLNESFATFMEMSYMSHSLGVNAAQREFEKNSQGYFAESRRYKRPIATNFYSDPGVMFDQHTYPKGGALLMSLRNMLGWKTFYSGLNLYIQRFHNGPAETNDLCEAMTDATGINMHPWFDQWILKPGHPVIDWTWSWDANAKQVVVHVKQTQDTTKGTPIYDVPTKIGLLYASGRVDKSPVRLNEADQTFKIAADLKPDAVVFDADQEFVREIPSQPWAAGELLTVARFAPNCVDRQSAFNQLVGGSPTDADVDAIVKSLQADQDLEPAISNSSALASLKRPGLRSFWISELNHKSFDRRAQAVRALAQLPNDPATDVALRDLVNDKTPYAEEAAAIEALSTLDYAASESMIRAQATNCANTEVRSAALNALVKNNATGANELVFRSLSEDQPDTVQTAGLNALGGVKGDDPRIVEAVRAAIRSHNFRVFQSVIQIAVTRKMKAVIPDLEQMQKDIPRAAAFLQPVIDQLRKD
jgi:aminopeptidase N